MDINTVTGVIQPGDLGFTMPHEHIIVAWDGTFLDSTLAIDWVELEREAIEKCKLAVASGIRTIVDMTTIEMGRDVSLLQRVSEASGLQIIAISGLFADAYGVPHYFRQLTEAQITDIYVRELTKGVGRTGVRTGAIKIATGQKELTDLERLIIRAGAKAHLETGAPILTHTGYGSLGDRQVDLLVDEGVDPARVVVGHSDVSANLRYHARILRKGATVGFDRIGLHTFMPDDIRAQCIAALIRMGFASRLTMSLDCHLRWCGRPNELVIEDRDFTWLARNFFPLLRTAGVSDEDINMIMTDNVRRLFE
ncbi:phosphotriesterase family protein [Dactylosporangium sp. CA-092794]|uniref:phosphotriesterase family protein n=1 Tax=Dactylosporangium sp. CA-092794 TaxID=3239929 RepID=UPI003D8D8396